MKEHPILFSTEMVKAILDGRKTVTRRVVKSKLPRSFHKSSTIKWIDHTKLIKRGKLVEVYSPGWYWSDNTAVCGAINGPIRCPYGQPGDLLWVRETWCYPSLSGCGFDHPAYRQKSILYAADGGKEYFPLGGNWTQHNRDFKWRPSIFMKKDDCRLWLRVKGVRVERVQDITTEDALREGIQYPSEVSAYNQFIGLWDSINEKRWSGWDVNPRVWVGEFEVVK